MARRFHRQLGVTLVEVIVMVFLMGILALLTNVCLKILNSLQREGSRIQTSRDASVLLYDMAREIRNAKSILYISSDTLQFTTYDFSKGFDGSVTGGGGSSAVLFDPLRIGTITYTCIVSAGATVLKKEELHPLPQGNRTTFSLRGVILMPDPFHLPTPEDTYLFQRRPNVTYCPCDYVSIRLRLDPAFLHDEPLEYSIDSALRSFSG